MKARQKARMASKTIDIHEKIKENADDLNPVVTILEREGSAHLAKQKRKGRTPLHTAMECGSGKGLFRLVNQLLKMYPNQATMKRTGKCGMCS